AFEVFLLGRSTMNAYGNHLGLYCARLEHVHDVRVREYDSWLECEEPAARTCHARVLFRVLYEHENGRGLDFLPHLWIEFFGSVSGIDNQGWAHAISANWGSPPGVLGSALSHHSAARHAAGAHHAAAGHSAALHSTTGAHHSAAGHSSAL